MKEKTDPEKTFRDQYAKDPPGVIFQELLAIHAQLNEIWQRLRLLDPTLDDLEALRGLIQSLKQEAGR